MKYIVTVVVAIFILVSNAFPMMHSMNSTGIVYADEFKQNADGIEEVDISDSAEAGTEISTEEAAEGEDSNSTEEIQEEESEVSDEKADPEILEKSDAPETTEDIAAEVFAGPASEINSETDEETSATDDVDDTVISENENSETVESTEAESSVVKGEMSTVAAPEDEISSVEAPTTSSENLLETPEDIAAEVDSTRESTETTKVVAPEDEESSNVVAPEEVQETAVDVVGADIQVSFEEKNLSDSDSDTVEKLYQEDITLHKTYEVTAGNESQILIDGLDPDQVTLSSDDFDISYVETDPFGGSFYKISPKNSQQSGQINLSIKGKDDAINYTFSVINGEDYDHPTFSKSQNVNFDSKEIYHVNYDMGDEDVISGPTYTVNYKDGVKYNLLYDRDILEKKGAKFVGWSFDKEGQKMIPADWKYLNSIEFPVYDSSNKDITLYAIYESDAADEPEPVDPVTPAPDPVDPVPVKPTPAPDPVDPVPVVPEPTPAPLPVPESPKQEEKQNPVEPDTHSSGHSGREILPVHAVFTSVPAVAEVPTEDLTALDESRPSSKPEVTTLVSVPPTVKNTHAPWITRSIKTGDNKDMIFHGIMLLLGIMSLNEWVMIWKIKTHRR